MSSRSEGAPQPGFLVVRADDGGTYVGGLMVTDASGLPVDFRYTDPVTPTRLQRALYGAVLDRYLRSEVVLRTLLDALERAAERSARRRLPRCSTSRSTPARVALVGRVAGRSDRGGRRAQRPRARRRSCSRPTRRRPPAARDPARGLAARGRRGRGARRASAGGWTCWSPSSACATPSR